MMSNLHDKLKSHKETILGKRMTEWFAAEPNRVADWTLKNAGIYLDLSKNHINAQTKALWQQWVDEAGVAAGIAAITRGDITVGGIPPRHLHLPLEKLKLAGAIIETYENGFRVRMDGRPRAVDFQTLPFPGFPTDLQPMAIGLAAVAEGMSVITENVFESRFRFVDEMLRLGADAHVDGHHVVMRGKEQLSSTTVWSSDIRAGAGLVLAALRADGVTEVRDVYHIDRGYPNFVENLNALGAKVERVVE